MSADELHIEPSEVAAASGRHCGEGPPPRPHGAIDKCTLCHVDLAFRLREQAADDAFQRVAEPREHACHGPRQARNGDEDAVPGAVILESGRPVRTGLFSFSKALRRRDAHDPLQFGGEPDPDAYESLLRPLNSTSPQDFEEVQLTRVQPGVTASAFRRLVNPQAGVDFDLEGPDSHGLVLPAPPSVVSPLAAAELGEDYWMAVLRDVHVKNYTAPGLGDPGAQALLQTAAEHLSSKDHGGDFSVINWPPVQPVAPGPDQAPPLPQSSLGRQALQIGPIGEGTGTVTPQILFRGFEPEVLLGPYLSQFLLRGNSDVFIEGSGPTSRLVVLQTPQDGIFSDGTGPCNQRQKTVLPDSDFLVGEQEWAQVQAGLETSGRDRIETTTIAGRVRPRLRFIRNLRDLANYVHFCDVTTPYMNAAFIMLNENIAEATRANLAGIAPSPPFPFNPGNPYSPATGPGVPALAVPSRTQVGFATFDVSHFVSVLDSVAWKAHKAEWFQKWFVHRRLRPEEFGGRVHFQITGRPKPLGPREPNPYPAIQHSEILAALQNPAGLGAHFGPGTPRGTFLLPQVFPEGSPVHPAYGQGHAVAAGACVTVLKAFFYDRAPMTDPSNLAGNPDRLPPAFIPDDSGDNLIPADPTQQLVLTVGGELNKLASNISLGRDAAGVHFRTDYIAGVLLGEAVAIGVLLDQSACVGATCTFNERTGPNRDQPPFFEFSRFDGVRIRIAAGRVSTVPL